MSAKRKNKPTNLIRRNVVAILFVGLFAGVGSFLLVRSQAAIPNNDFRGSGGVVADYSIYSDTQNPTERHAVGSTFTRNYYLHFPSSGTYPHTTHHLQFYLRWYAKEVKHLQSKFDCGDATPCVKVATPGYAESGGIANLIYCFEITPAMRSQGDVRLFSTEFQQISATSQNWVDDLLYLFSGECSGYFENGPPAQDANYLAFSRLGNGNLGSGIANSNSVSSGSDTKGTGSGSGTKGNGTGSTGIGTGGGSSGSTATKQGTDPNSTPSSSGQGNKNQTKLDPSPFYDGKEYNRGSDSDSGGVFDIFSSKKTTTATKLWRIGILAGLVAAIAGTVYWRKRH